MNTITRGLLASTILATVIATPAAFSEEMVNNYFVDGSGAEVKSGNGDCVRTSFKETDDRRVACGYPEPEVPVMVTQEIVAAPGAASVTTTVDELIAIDAAVLFPFGSAELSDDGKAVIDERIARFKGRAERSVPTQVIGHTDSTGPAEYNQTLSEQRAQSVVDHIQSQTGVPNDQIEVIGMGENDPVASNDTAEGRALNRRVVIRFEGVATE